jgi:flavin-dependent dehydrogenase
VQPEYDVIIMGGGPGGSTLGALLAKKSNLRVALFDKEVFPREHIGESFAHPLIPVLEESGALPKVLASDCWVKKFGGIFNWADQPNVAYFDHANWANDGVYRWAMHVDRAEFDHILLDHAESLGVEVYQGTAISAFDPYDDHCVVTLKDGRQLRAKYFVDASGRRNSIATKQKREWLSGYRNIAIWQHFVGGRTTQSLAGDWNIFREEDISPIGCFAFPDGWCWYIPVPKIVDGERVVTHSIGIVTDPAVLKHDGKNFVEQDQFIAAVNQVPLLKDLIGDATPIDDKMLTATNYSMINDQFANLDERWILIGDASYFVDPLFSSGVAFAATQAASASLVLRKTLDPSTSEEDSRNLWRDYDEGWHGMASTYALSIDQWYHAIAKNNPGSIYWESRVKTVDLGIQERTFDFLLNTAFTPDLLQVMTSGTRELSDLDSNGPFRRAAALAEPDELDPETEVALSTDTTVTPGPGLDVPGFKAFVPPPPFEMPDFLKAAIAEYWKDPVANGAVAPSPTDETSPCHRFTLAGNQVSGLDRDGAAELVRVLEEGPEQYGKLAVKLSLPQLQLLKRLIRAGMVTVVD